MGKKQTGMWVFQLVSLPPSSVQRGHSRQKKPPSQAKQKEGPTQAGISASQSFFSKGAVHFVAEMSLCVF